MLTILKSNKHINKFAAIKLINKFQINYLNHVMLLKINYTFVTLMINKMVSIIVNCTLLRMSMK